MPLRYSYGDESWLQDEITVGEVCAIEKHLGVLYGDIQPLSNMTHRLAVFVSFMSRTRSEDEAEKMLSAMRASEFADLLTWEADDDLPVEFEDGLPLDQGPGTDTRSTGGSSSPTVNGDGLPTSPDDNPSET